MSDYYLLVIWFRIGVVRVVLLSFISVNSDILHQVGTFRYCGWVTRSVLSISTKQLPRLLDIYHLSIDNKLLINNTSDNVNFATSREFGRKCNLPSAAKAKTPSCDGDAAKSPELRRSANSRAATSQVARQFAELRNMSTHTFVFANVLQIEEIICHTLRSITTYQCIEDIN